MKAVVLGGYGLIGAACIRALRTAGFDVVGIGRSIAAGRRVDVTIPWIATDIARTAPADWRRLLDGADVIVNASGALQDGARDRVSAIHEDAIASLISAIDEKPLRFIQISAAGASQDASNAFLRTKANGDAMIMTRSLDWTILRPALVIGPQAYGGSALLRAAAALPFARLEMFPQSTIQTIALDELAEAVVDVACGRVASRRVYDLAEEDGRAFPDLIASVRGWLGFPNGTFHVRLPAPLVRVLARVCDALGYLGWRPPLRTAALDVLERGIVADPSDWRACGGKVLGSLDETLRAMPAGIQERWFARLYLLLPLAVATLSLFWILSGAIALWMTEAAVSVLIARGFGETAAAAIVMVGALVDLALGLAVLYRPLARAACLAMIGVSLGYLAGATVFASDLWADPLGPLVKVLPQIALAGITVALLEER